MQTAHPDVQRAHSDVQIAHSDMYTSHSGVQTTHFDVHTAHSNMQTAHSDVQTDPSLQPSVRGRRQGAKPLRSAAAAKAAYAGVQEGSLQSYIYKYI